METRIRMKHGLAYDLVLTIPKDELDDCLLSFPGWIELADSYGYLRHPVPDLPPDATLPASLDPQTQEWRKSDKGIVRYKIPPEGHLEPSVGFGAGSTQAVHGLNMVDGFGRPTRRLILIGNRNLGNNSWFVAWHREKDPRCFHLRDEPLDDREYSCLVWFKDRGLGIERIRFRAIGSHRVPHRASDGASLAESTVWGTYGQQVLRDGAVVGIEEIIDQFYDARHVLYYPVMAGYERGQTELRAIYEGYPAAFKKRLIAEWRAGRPRSRYLHNAVGIGPHEIIILQRHGTVEEIGHWLRDEGAEDGLILDNGGSVFTWAWWAFKEMVEAQGRRVARTGNVVFCAPDWRPPSISLIAFVLKGPPRHEESSGTVAMAMV